MDPNTPEKPRPEGQDTDPGTNDDSLENDAGSAAGDADAKADSESDQLSPEEQMALYEESLKDTDWGHQPC